MTPEIVTSITAVFTDLGGDVLPILVPIASAASGIFIIFMAFRYGKKIFKIVSNG